MKILLAPDAAPTAGAPPAAPIPAPTAPGAAPSPPDANDDDPFARVDEKFFPKEPTEPKPDKGGTPPADKGKAPEKGKIQPDTKKPSAPAELRTELERVKGELKTKTESLSSLEAKIADYEKRGKDTEALVKRHADLEKSIAAKDAEIRALKHEASPEFKQKYDLPYQQRAEDAKAEIETLQVGEWRTDEATGTKTWVAARKAGWETDFATIFNLPYAEAKSRSKELFGEEAGLVMEHYRDLHRMQDTRSRALEQEKADAQKLQEEEQSKQATVRESFELAAKNAQKDLENRFPDFFTAELGDKEAEEALKEGWALLNLTPKTVKQAVALAARNRLNAASAIMMQLKNRRLSAKVAELEAKLEKRNSGGPGGTKSAASGGAADPGEDDSPEKWKEEARKMLVPN